MPPEVTNLPLPVQSAPERQAAAMEQLAAAAKKQSDAFALTTGFSGNPARDEFREVLLGCLAARVAPDINGLFTFAQELVDGLEVRFPTPKV